MGRRLSGNYLVVIKIIFANTLQNTSGIGCSSCKRRPWNFPHPECQLLALHRSRVGSNGLWKHYHLTSSRLKNGPYGIYNHDASNNYFERLITHDNYETGFQLEGASANNVVLYLDSYANRDPRKNVSLILLLPHEA